MLCVLCLLYVTCVVSMYDCVQVTVLHRTDLQLISVVLRPDGGVAEELAPVYNERTHVTVVVERRHALSAFV